MKGFLLGLLIAGLGFGAYLYWQHQKSINATLAAATADAGAPTTAKKTKKRSRGAIRVARAQDSTTDSDSEPVRLSASDVRPVAQGDDLSTPDVLRLDMSNDKELPELTQDQIDERFRAEEPAIVACIAHARPDPETYVPGKVTIKFRIQRAGTVRGVRVEAPAVLQRNGLFGCIKAVISHLRFPAAGTSQIISYPFKLS